MTLKLMGNTVPVNAACRDAAVDVSSDESVLILIRHCRDMKRQEACLRLITLLLLLSCAALFLFTLCVDLRKYEESGSSGHEVASQQSPAYAKQVGECRPDNARTNHSAMHVQLWSVPVKNATSKLYMKWTPMFGETNFYNKEKQAIVIPQQGLYFLYMRVGLGCQRKSNEERKFHMKLHSWNERYDIPQVLTEAWDGVQCTSDVSKDMFVGQLFELLEGDHVSVWIEEGYQLITRSLLGAFLT